MCVDSWVTTIDNLEFSADFKLITVYLGYLCQIFNDWGDKREREASANIFGRQSFQFR